MTVPDSPETGSGKQITVNLPENPYPVYVGGGILRDRLKAYAGTSPAKVFLVTNQTLLGLYGGLIEEIQGIFGACPVHAIPDGERHKSLETLSGIYDFLIENGASRSHALIALGGGVVGDVAGHAAATFMRGMDFVQIPTTLLSQVDSGIGGKTGVNHPRGKNIIGSFKQPLFSLLDAHFLKTLPERELISGYAEIAKHAFIRDAELFEFLDRIDPLQALKDPELTGEIVYKSCGIKARVVEADEKESNLRAILNFGHTLGHLIETATDYREYLHGEAVIGGMDFAAWLSFAKIGNDPESYRRVKNHLKKTGVKVRIPKLSGDRFVDILMKDKKNYRGGIRFVYLKKIGQAEVLENQPLEDLRLKFREYLQSENPLVSVQD